VSKNEEDMLNQAINELRVLPPLDRGAVSRIVAAATAARAALDDVDETVPAFLPPARSRILAWSTITGIAVAAGIAGFAIRGVVVRPVSTTETVTAPSDPGVTTVKNDSSDLRPIPTPFALSRPGARNVRLIGDFNGWGADSAITLTRDADGVWSVLLPLVPGRHTYAFVVDDSIVLDPRARTAKDPDFGILRSVVIVGKP
jgi:hypothetical protein